MAVNTFALGQGAGAAFKKARWTALASHGAGNGVSSQLAVIDVSAVNRDFACVITAVWPRDQGGTEVALGAVQWVYNVTRDLLPLSSGAYGADLG
ncbi:hypothetical protein FOWG_17171 [Fusarium oxysporum f. sp. lycopersici MN25]|nr:hypothetical protein FOWG_17171 [Fusarium oxysporum f. sp. lycopersici MN25]